MTLCAADRAPTERRTRCSLRRRFTDAPPAARAIVVWLAVAASVAALSGCTLTGRTPPPPIATYVLAAPPPNATKPDDPTAILKIATPTAAPAYSSSRMAYIETPYRVDYFAQNEWADAPARMLKSLLTQYLGESGLFRFVYADSGGIDEGLRLDSDIVELAQVFSPDSSEVRVSIRFALVDVAHRTLLMNRTFSVTEPAAARDPYAGVVAANKALQRIFADLTTALSGEIAIATPTPNRIEHTGQP